MMVNSIRKIKRIQSLLSQSSQTSWKVSITKPIWQMREIKIRDIYFTNNWAMHTWDSVTKAGTSSTGICLPSRTRHSTLASFSCSTSYFSHFDCTCPLVWFWLLSIFIVEYPKLSSSEEMSAHLNLSHGILLSTP